MNDMFCFQCQETAKNEGCVLKGVCGKDPQLSSLQDLLVYLLKGISYWGVRGRQMGVGDRQADLFVVEALFSTITNANFDPDRFVLMINQALERRDTLKLRLQEAAPELLHDPMPDWAVWLPQRGDMDELVRKGMQVGVLADPDLEPDIHSLRQLLIIGLKGLAAYTDHAIILHHNDDELLYFMQEALEATTNDELAVDQLVSLVLRCGDMGVQSMALLDAANTSAYGSPEPTQVSLDVRPGPAILVSGHDLLDLDELLQQSAGKGINIYTHGEMLPANAYPAFKKHPHLVGNYGGSWWHQSDEFEKFGGPILMTTNCVIKPRPSYQPRLFTTGVVGWPGCPHIPDRQPGGQKDFSPLIEMALGCQQPQQLEQGSIPIGFAHTAVSSVVDKVVAAVKNGDIQRFVVMAGCDGRQASRKYYTEMAEALPHSTVILTAGCAKYRYNKLQLGDIGGIPRILDAGQCNDSYSLVVIAQKLVDAFGVDHINDLPISYDIAWYEQKAVIVLLALLALGVKNIRLGPTLPAFLSPNVLQVLVENFNLMPIDTVAADLEAIMVGR